MADVIEFPSMEVRDMASIRRHLHPLLRQANLSSEAEANLLASLRRFLDLLAFEHTIPASPGHEKALQQALQRHAQMLFFERIDRELQFLGIDPSR